MAKGAAVEISILPGDQARLLGRLARKVSDRGGPVAKLLGKAAAAGLETLGDEIDNLVTKEAQHDET